MRGQTLDIDVTKDSKVRTNVWLLCILIAAVLFVYAYSREASENNRDRVRENLEQERHFVSTDARVVDLEKRQAVLERQYDRILYNLDYLREHQEREDRRNGTSP